MKTLLRIDTSIRIDGSYTRAITDYFEKAWLGKYPDGNVIRRCMVRDPVPHLTQGTLEVFHAPYSPNDHNTLSDQLISELMAADHLLLGSPFYNLSLPSTLKAYWDHVVRSGVTFEVRDEGYHGLLQNKKATLVTAQAGTALPNRSDDHQTEYLKSILKFIGIDCIDVVAMDGLGAEQSMIDKTISEAKRQVDMLINSQQPLWIGDFTEKDQYEITTVRDTQAIAIVEGDAEKYARLCTEDIQLMIPGKDRVVGVNEFLKIEQDLFENASFERFIKYPERIERSGTLAVETGRQEVSMRQARNRDGVYASQQKYTHVFRKTDCGWRFCLLMSNPCG